MALLAREYGTENARAHQLGMRALNPSRIARDARTRTALLRTESEELRSLSADDAARLIETKRAERELAQRRTEQRQRRLLSLALSPHRSPVQIRSQNAASDSDAITSYGMAVSEVIGKTRLEAVDRGPR
ncbi:hypothetical protein [Homoserinimonas sp. OAct 916]|uniref:hypothetical protein n=1 Tax=Homoserinimonas sp. OAct 916 TaxID=2211450 RepID=UPI000DBE3F2A|nr:hypothetical protein [Homoserinimonas sp. OAct 916]